MAVGAGEGGHLVDHQEHPVYVKHGATAGTARPTLGSTGTAGVVCVWDGSVAPTAAVSGDYWWDTSADALKRYNGTSWTASGSSTYRADDTPIWVPPSGLSAVGVGTATASSTLRWPLWTMAIDTIIATTLPAFPSGWTTFDIDVWWTNLTANSGNVNLTMRSEKSAGDGELLVQPNAGTAVIGAAPAQNVVKVTTVISGQATVASKLANLNLLRSNTSDTLTGNIGVLGINMRKAS